VRPYLGEEGAKRGAFSGLLRLKVGETISNMPSTAKGKRGGCLLRRLEKSGREIKEGKRSLMDAQDRGEGGSYCREYQQGLKGRLKLGRKGYGTPRGKKVLRRREKKTTGGFHY